MPVLSLETLQKDILDLVAERDWDQFHSPKNLAIALSNEASELLELYMWGEEPRKQKAVEEEVADVLYCLLLFAAKNKIDVTEALKKKLVEIKAKYPIEKSRGNAKKYSDF